MLENIKDSAHYLKRCAVPRLSLETNPSFFFSSSITLGFTSSGLKQRETVMNKKILLSTSIESPFKKTNLLLLKYNETVKNWECCKG